MQRSSTSKIKKLYHQVLRNNNNNNSLQDTSQKPCDVFINHRGIDTKRNIVGLLYHHLRGLGLNPFLDSKSMKPGDKLSEKIDVAIRECKVGVAVFSPKYCHSYSCLHELSHMMELKKRIVPIFCNVKPSELRVRVSVSNCAEKDLNKFRLALEGSRNTVGLRFDTLNGDWPELISNATVVINKLVEEEDEVLVRKPDDKVFARNDRGSYNLCN